MKRRTKSDGAILISTIIVLLIVSLVSTLLTYQVITTSHLLVEQRNARALHAEITEELLSSPTTSPLQTAESERHGRRAVITSRYTLGKSDTPLYRLAPFLQVSEQCPLSAIEKTEKTPTHLLFSGYAPFPEESCVLKKITLTSTTPFHTRQNLFTEEIQQPPQRTESIILANGAIDIQKVLTVTNALLLIAGGDISIASLKATQPSARIEVISLNGGITINSVTGSLTLYIDAFTHEQLPTSRGIKRETTPTLIEKSKGWLAGITVGR
jgi:hypothetical protein